MSKKEATIIQNFNAEKRKYEYSIKGYDVTKSIEILLKKHKEEYDKERRVFESTKGYLEAQQEYEKHITNLQSQLDQLKQQLVKKDKEIKSLIVDYEKRISQEQELMSNMEHRLTEKQNTIDEINKEFVQAVHDWKTLCAEKDKEIKKLNWQLKDKDFIIKNLNHSLSVTPNANAGQRARIDELTKIVKEKDKEIERLKNLFELNNEVVINQGKEIFDLRVQVLQQKQNQTQLAIQELEKVKEYMNSEYGYDCCADVSIVDEFIDNQIKELKGE